MKLYSVEITRLKKSLFLLDKDSQEYKTRMTDKILELQSNEDATAQALCRFVCGERGKALIIVLDNCDKQKRDEQLFMFQVAQWVKQEFRCLVFLPLRDVTYDNYRQVPPLDTALKDLVFRIEPPLFSEVLKKRIMLVFDQMQAETKSNSLTYYLPNGYKVVYPKTDQSLYLASILKSLFEYDRFIRRIITGLAGRDVRRAMEIFLEFCTEPTSTRSEILKIRQLARRPHAAVPSRLPRAPSDESPFLRRRSILPEEPLSVPSGRREAEPFHPVGNPPVAAGSLQEGRADGSQGLPPGI